jgi:hypothetical protein
MTGGCQNSSKPSQATQIENLPTENVCIGHSVDTGKMEVIGSAKIPESKWQSYCADVRIGMTQAQVIAILGDDDPIKGPRVRKSRVTNAEGITERWLYPHPSLPSGAPGSPIGATLDFHNGKLVAISQ